MRTDPGPPPIPSRPKPRTRDRLGELSLASQHSLPVRARALVRLQGQGAYFQLGEGLYGWAAEEDLPETVRRGWESAAPPDVECLVINPTLAADGGHILVSPREAGLKYLRTARRTEIVEGTVRRTREQRVEVDFNGALASVDRGELSLDMVCHPPPPGALWRGYVMRMPSRGLPALSQFSPGQRRTRSDRRALDIRAHKVESVHEGRVVALHEERALVAFENGLIYGVAPAGRQLTPRAARLRINQTRHFRVVSQYLRRDGAAQCVEVWVVPVDPAGARSRRPRPDHDPPGGIRVPRLPQASPVWAHNAWSQLPRSWRIMLDWRYGLRSKVRRYSTIANDFGITDVHVRRIVREAEWELLTAAGLGKEEIPSVTDHGEREFVLRQVLGLDNA
jgi:hypothetical protein